MSSKILLQDIDVLTFRKNEWTTGRRLNPIPQLKCIGGDAFMESYNINVIQCYNVGFDGYDVNWKCEAQLKSDIKLGQVDVLCEGYDDSYDPYILVGSCGLEFELNYEKNSKTPIYTNSNGIIVFIFIILMVIIGAVICCNKINTNPRNNYSYPPNKNSKKRKRRKHINTYPENHIYYDSNPPPTAPLYEAPTYIHTTVPVIPIPPTPPVDNFMSGFIAGSSINNNEIYEPEITPEKNIIKETSVSYGKTKRREDSSDSSSSNDYGSNSISFGKTRRR